MKAKFLTTLLAFILPLALLAQGPSTVTVDVNGKLKKPSATTFYGANPPLPVSIVYASRLGCAQNGTSVGGGTDDTALLQAALNTAPTVGALELVIDKGICLTTGLNVYSNTSIRCNPGCGFALANSANRAIVRNVHPVRPASAGAANGRIDTNISLVGGIYYGNSNGNGHQDASGTWTTAIGFFGVQNLTLTNITVQDSRTFGTWIADCGRVTISGHKNLLSQVVVGPSSPQHDGIHFNGPSEDITVDDCYIESGDDFLPFNADDGQGDLFVTNELGPWVGRGPIVRVKVSNINVGRSYWGIRLLSKVSLIDQVSFSHIHGNVDGHIIDIEPYDATSPGNVGTVSFDDIDLRKSGAANVPSGNDAYRIDLAGVIKQARFSNIRRDQTNAADGSREFQVSAQMDLLDIDGCDITDPPGFNSEYFAQFNTGTNIKVLRVNRVNWLRGTGSNVTAFLVNSGGTIGRVNLSNILLQNVNTGYAEQGNGTTEIMLDHCQMINPSAGAEFLYLASVLTTPITASNFSGNGASFISGPGATTVINGDAVSHVDRIIFTDDGTTITVIYASSGFTGAVNRLGLGHYSFPLSTATANYSVAITLFPQTVAMVAYINNTGEYQGAGFNVQVARVDNQSAVNPQGMTVTIFH